MTAGFTFKSTEEHIAFLEQQLCAAIAMLRQKDQTEAEIAAKYDRQSTATVDSVKQQLRDQVTHLQQLEKTLVMQVTRYRFLRQYQVQIWKLGIAATGEQLDKALDEHIERLRKLKETIP